MSTSSTIVRRMRAAADLLDKVELDPTLDEVSVSFHYHASTHDGFSAIGIQGSLETIQKILTVLGLEISEKRSWTGDEGHFYTQTLAVVGGFPCSITSVVEPVSA